MGSKPLSHTTSSASAPRASSGARQPRRALWLGCAALLLTPALAVVPARADEAPLAGRAASLQPLAASELVLKSQTVEFVFVPERRGWSVVAHYEIANPSGKPQAAQLGLPEYPCSADAPSDSETDDTCDPTRTGFSQLEATIAGKPQRLSKRRMPRAAAGATGPDQVWILPLRVAAGETTPVELHYSVPALEPGAGGYGASYLLRNPQWSKPIGRATFKFLFSAHSCLVVEPDQPARKSRRVILHGEAQEPWLELVYEAYVWTPRADLTLFFEPCLAARDTESPDCPAASDLARFFYPAEADEEVEPISEVDLRTRLTKLSDAELEHCRDAVFAAYAGYFQPSELKKLPTHSESNRHYTAPLLTASDWAWVHFLDQRVAERTSAKRAADAAKQRVAATAAAAHGGCKCSALGAGRDVPMATPLGMLLLWASRVRRRVRRR